MFHMFVSVYLSLHCLTLWIAGLFISGQSSSVLLNSEAEPGSLSLPVFLLFSTQARLGDLTDITLSAKKNTSLLTFPSAAAFVCIMYRAGGHSITSGLTFFRVTHT